MRNVVFATLLVFWGCQSAETIETCGGAGSTGWTIPTVSTLSTASPSCDPADCPETPHPDCGYPICENNACGLVRFAAGTPCGFAGTCAASGECEGLTEPLSCPGECPDLSPCATGHCDPYSGTCKLFYHDNGTACEGDGHCNEFEGSCCHGMLVLECLTIADPLACFGSCVNNNPDCWVACEPACPVGLVAVPEQGVCVPGQ